MDKNRLYNEAKLVIDSMLQESPMLTIDHWSVEKTAVIVVDMIKGFAIEGNLHSKRVEGIIDNNVKVLEKFSSNHIFLCDNHKEDAVEFDTFLPHCITDSGEELVVDDLQKYSSKGMVIEKNSTNGFIEPRFQEWLNETPLTDFIVTGCCTDLCVLQFVLSLKTHFNRLNISSRIAVIENAVETYDIDAIYHPGDFTHLMSLKMMKDNGILLRRI